LGRLLVLWGFYPDGDHDLPAITFAAHPDTAPWVCKFDRIGDKVPDYLLHQPAEVPGIHGLGFAKAIGAEQIQANRVAIQQVASRPDAVDSYVQPREQCIETHLQLGGAPLRLYAPSWQALAFKPPTGQQGQSYRTMSTEAYEGVVIQGKFTHTFGNPRVAEEMSKLGVGRYLRLLGVMEIAFAALFLSFGIARFFSDTQLSADQRSNRHGPVGVQSRPELPVMAR
jgi:hypothetical protein